MSADETYRRVKESNHAVDMWREAVVDCDQRVSRGSECLGVELWVLSRKIIHFWST